MFNLIQGVNIFLSCPDFQRPLSLVSDDFILFLDYIFLREESGV